MTTGYNVWGQTYEQASWDVFAVQDSVAVQVVEAVRGRLTRQELARLTPRVPTVNSEAYDAYLRGTAVLRARTTAAGASAIEQFRRAIALDPNFAAGHARLAEAYALAAIWGWDVPDVPYDSLASFAQHAAGRALALDRRRRRILARRGDGDAIHQSAPLPGFAPARRGTRSQQHRSPASAGRRIQSHGRPR